MNKLVKILAVGLAITSVATILGGCAKVINILLENTQIDARWLYGSLKKYIKPNSRVAVVALSFKENRVRNLEDWDALYSKDTGRKHFVSKLV